MGKIISDGPPKNGGNMEESGEKMEREWRKHTVDQFL